MAYTTIFSHNLFGYKLTPTYAEIVEVMTAGGIHVVRS